MALMESSTSTAHNHVEKFDHYDNLFDQLVDSDPFDLGDDLAPDLGATVDWGSLVVEPDARSGTAHTSSPSLQVQRSNFPHCESKFDATVPSVPEQFVSLATWDSIQNLTQLHLSALFSRRNNSQSAANNSGLEHKPRSIGICKPFREASVPLEMSHRQQSRKQSSNKSQRKATQSPEESEPSDQRHQGPSTAAPTSAPIAQTPWQSTLHYPAYSTQQPGSAIGSSSQLAYRQSSLSPEQQGYEPSSYSPSSTPHAEHSGGEEMSSYLRSSPSPFFGGYESVPPRGYSSYPSRAAQQQGFPVAEMQPTYGQQEFTGAAGQRSWATGATQPYSPNPAFEQASEEASQHVNPGPLGQSEFAASSGGLAVKRVTDASGPQFSNTGASQRQQSAYDFPPRGLGRSQARQDPLAGPHRRSSSPSLGSPSASSAKKPSRSGRPAGARQRRSRATGSLGRRETTSGFVNYTPEDSGKLLTGVAPSGSSKTKARREKEAAEKQRKLKQAAVEAGADIETLERQGFGFEKEEDEDEEAQST